MSTPVIAQAVCPACNGSTRRPCPDNLRQYRIATYRESDNTLACNNCGGQTMNLSAKGVTRIDPATGLGCLHTYVGQQAGNCYRVYTCSKCGDRYDIDSSD
jgi:hypothetical protein